MKSTALLCALAVLAGCAAAPPPAPPPSDQPLNGNMVRSAVAPQTQADKDTAAWARQQGYRLQRRDDKVMWCRRIAEVGTKLEHNDCVSDDTIVAMRKNAELNQGQLQQALGACTGQAACGSK